MVVCVNCGLEVVTLYHVYNEVNYCLSTCGNCGKICDKYVEWEIPLIIIDLFLFKTQVYRHLIHNHSNTPENFYSHTSHTSDSTPGSTSNTSYNTSHSTTNTSGSTSNSTLNTSYSTKNTTTSTPESPTGTISNTSNTNPETPDTTSNTTTEALGSTPYSTLNTSHNTLGITSNTSHNTPGSSTGSTSNTSNTTPETSDSTSGSTSNTSNSTTETPDSTSNSTNNTPGSTSNSTSGSATGSCLHSNNSSIRDKVTSNRASGKVTSNSIRGIRINISVRVILLLISATILDSYSMLTSCNYLTNPPNICFPQFQSYNQSILNQITKYFHPNSSSNTSNTINSSSSGTSHSTNSSSSGSTGGTTDSVISYDNSEDLLELVDKMSNVMMCYSRLNIFKRVGMNAEYCNRTYSRAMELFFLIFLQNPTLCSWSKNLTADCKDITELGIISLSILRVLSYCLYIIISYTILRKINYFIHNFKINYFTHNFKKMNYLMDKKGIKEMEWEKLEKIDNLREKKINPKVDRVSENRGKFLDKSAANTNNGIDTLNTVSSVNSVKKGGLGLKGVMNMFYALLLSFHIKSLVLMINVWYPTHTILIVIEFYIYLNHIVELKAISNLSIVTSAFLVVTGALLKIAIYFIWFHLINTFNLHYFYS